MIEFDDVTRKNRKERNPNWPQDLDDPYRILIIGGSGSEKTNALLYLIIHQSDHGKINLYAKDPYEAKYQFLINNCESVGSQLCNDSKAFIEYPMEMNDNYENIDEYYPKKKHKILVIFDDIIADMLSDKKDEPIITELFIRGRKLNIFLVFVTQSYFTAPKKILE